ncbi:hypothetical protein Cgig2_012871 [Carnegiea gigantea]|uniref:Protein kinase domain-containing protein n=2 Tax=Cactaceae TaxID=3593 RepID=A0A9Q1Q8W9_9CARY|nr:hypothetical protein Cgig2_012871 [Carnegiea gigantea]
MEDASSVDYILEFLQKNGFSQALDALRNELNNRPDRNGFEKLTLEDKKGKKVREENADKLTVRDPESSAWHTNDISKELIVKEIECGTARNSKENKQKSTTSASAAECRTSVKAVGMSDKSLAFSKVLEDPLLDLYSWKCSQENDAEDPCASGCSITNPWPIEGQSTGPSKFQVSDVGNAGKLDLQPNDEIIFSEEKQPPWRSGTDTANTGANYGRKQTGKLKGVEQRKWNYTSHSRDNFTDETWSRQDEALNSSSSERNERTVKTVPSFSNMYVGTTSASAGGSSKKEGSGDMADIRAAIKEQIDEVGRSLYLAKLQGICDNNNLDDLGLTLVSESQKEELPRLPPVRLRSVDKPLSSDWKDRFDHDGPSLKLSSGDDSTYLIGSYLDVPVGQEVNSSAGTACAWSGDVNVLLYDAPTWHFARRTARTIVDTTWHRCKTRLHLLGPEHKLCLSFLDGQRMDGGNWLSVSRGIAEDTSDLVSGFATIGDGLSESIDYHNDYWDSDEYDDDDDVGYMRQPIEDEAWFLAHEIDYPSDNEKTTRHGSTPDPHESAAAKVEEDDRSFAEEDAYFSGDQNIHSKQMEPISASDDPIGLTVTEVYDGADENDIIARYDGHLMDEEELNLMRSEPVWQGFVTQSDDLIILGDGNAMHECGRPVLDDGCIGGDHHGSVRSIGVGINSDTAESSSEVGDSLVVGSSEGNFEYFHDHEIASGASSNPQKKIFKAKNKRNDSDKYLLENDRSNCIQLRNNSGAGFSFAPPISDEPSGFAKALWSTNSNVIGDVCNNGLSILGRDADMLAAWTHKSSTSPVRSPGDGIDCPIVRSAETTPSTISDYAYADHKHANKADEKMAVVKEENVGESLEDEEAVAVQEQVRQIKSQEEEFETFNLKIVHRKNRTGFEEEKNFHVVLNSVIAGRYHVTEYLGSAAFSKAIQAHDLHTGMDVCIKIIKNNKDFFDQSLDEIKLLKFVNKHDPADKYHILRLYDYFYYREHLLIVCELLKANLYEFHKFNRESGGEVYFTMPRLQSITIQVLEALQFLHSLGLIHCDLKPENILVKSYSRCEVKVIDLGSSCFETDHLCSYVQSRSYRAPEVILGLPYDKKIDIWSLGCILAELCTGNVLFQNDSPATLLARVIGIIGPIDQGMLAKGKDTYKYFTKNHMLYERNQETNKLEYLMPKKSSLRHRLPMGDQGFMDFVAHLLEVNPKKRPSASEALKHPWLSYPYEPISS